MEFIDELSTWYVRRSRERFKGVDEADKNQAIFALGKTLFELAKLLAPYAPFVAEHIYQELGKNCGTLKKSVHLEDWPVVHEEMIDQKVLDNMEMTRKIVEMGLAKRAEAGVKVRQPLNELRVKSYELREEYGNLIKDELNVKEVSLIHQSNENGDIKAMEGKVVLDTHITEELKQEGNYRELVRAIQDMRKKIGLNPNDVIGLEVATSVDGQEVINKFKAELLKAVGAKEIKIKENNGVEAKIDGMIFTINIIK